MISAVFVYISLHIAVSLCIIRLSMHSHAYDWGIVYGWLDATDCVWIFFTRCTTISAYRHVQLWARDHLHSFDVFCVYRCLGLFSASMTARYLIAQPYRVQGSFESMLEWFEILCDCPWLEILILFWLVVNVYTLDQDFRQDAEITHRICACICHQSQGSTSSSEGCSV